MGFLAMEHLLIFVFSYQLSQFLLLQTSAVRKITVTLWSSTYVKEQLVMKDTSGMTV